MSAFRFPDQPDDETVGSLRLELRVALLGLLRAAVYHPEATAWAKVYLAPYAPDIRDYLGRMVPSQTTAAEDLACLDAMFPEDDTKGGGE